MDEAMPEELRRALLEEPTVVTVYDEHTQQVRIEVTCSRDGALLVVNGRRMVLTASEAATLASALRA